MIKVVIISKNENTKSIKYILKNFRDYDVYLISPKAKESKYIENNLIKLNDNEILDFNKLKEELNIERFGWYYQQFLKYQAVLTLDGDNFLIVDGDTIIDTKFTKKNTLFTTGKKTFAKYSNLYMKLFPNHSLCGKSFITNQMLFHKPYLQQLLKDIESTDSKLNNWIKIISNHIKNNDNYMFSEYQMYAEYVLNKGYQFNIQKISIFRRMDLIKDSIENGLKKYDILAYENHHKTDFLRYLRAKVYYMLGISIG